jgi:hypothetical protein
MNAKTPKSRDVYAHIGTSNISITTRGNTVTAQIQSDSFEQFRGKVFSLISITSAQIKELMLVMPNGKGKMKFSLPDDLPDDSGIQLRLRARDPKREVSEPYDTTEKVWHPPYESK